MAVDPETGSQDKLFVRGNQVVVVFTRVKDCKGVVQYLQCGDNSVAGIVVSV